MLVNVKVNVNVSWWKVEGLSGAAAEEGEGGEGGEEKKGRGGFGDSEAGDLIRISEKVERPSVIGAVGII